MISILLSSIIFSANEDNSMHRHVTSNHFFDLGPPAPLPKDQVNAPNFPSHIDLSEYRYFDETGSLYKWPINTLISRDGHEHKLSEITKEDFEKFVQENENENFKFLKAINPPHDYGNDSTSEDDDEEEHNPITHSEMADESTLSWKRNKSFKKVNIEKEGTNLPYSAVGLLEGSIKDPRFKEPYNYLGTGFLAREDMILSAAHVVIPRLIGGDFSPEIVNHLKELGLPYTGILLRNTNRLSGQLSFTLGYQEKISKNGSRLADKVAIAWHYIPKEWYEFIPFNKAWDFAVLFVRHHYPSHQKLLILPPKGSEIIETIGYPGFIKNGEKIKPNSPLTMRKSKGKVSAICHLDPKMQRIYHTCGTFHGNSGGTISTKIIVTDKGNATYPVSIGIHTRARDENDEVNNTDQSGTAISQEMYDRILLASQNWLDFTKSGKIESAINVYNINREFEQLERGKTFGQASMIKMMLKRGRTEDEISEFIGLSLEEIKSLLSFDMSKTT